MTLELHKLVWHTEEIYIEGSKAAETPLRLHAVSAIITNPWAGRGFVEDLTPTILDLSPQLSDIMVPRLTDIAGSPDKVEGYGKAAMVGTSGEIEHGSALIHTLRFGNKFRDAVGGTAYLSFTNSRDGPGAMMQLPMMHKVDAELRSRYLALDLQVSNAPFPDEIMLAIGASVGGRPHHRIGNRYSDMQEMGITENHS